MEDRTDRTFKYKRKWHFENHCLRKGKASEQLICSFQVNGVERLERTGSRAVLSVHSRSRRANDWNESNASIMSMNESIAQ